MNPRILRCDPVLPSPFSRPIARQPLAFRSHGTGGQFSGRAAAEPHVFRPSQFSGCSSMAAHFPVPPCRQSIFRSRDTAYQKMAADGKRPENRRQRHATGKAGSLTIERENGFGRARQGCCLLSELARHVRAGSASQNYRRGTNGRCSLS